MRKLILLFILLSALHISSAQKLTLTDLTTLCNKKNWEDVNQSLNSKNWSFHDSKKGDHSSYNTIIWSFNKDSYGDKAQAWFYLYTYENFPNKIVYSVFNKESYTLIQNSLSANGFKLTNSEIEDNEVISTYTNKGYTLTISTAKRESSEISSRSSITAYSITLIKRLGVYDSNNGKKFDYWYGGEKIKTEYSLKDGKLNGAFVSYYYNGQIKRVGNYLNGKENGNFKEYDEDGLLEASYTMKNDELNGVLILYDKNKKRTESNYVDGRLSGTYKKYLYDDYGRLIGIEKGNYLNDKQDGRWSVVVIEDKGIERELFKYNYINGLKNGEFQEVKGDSLIIGEYHSGQLNGKYLVYRDFFKMITGDVIRTDTTKLQLICEGSYYNGLKTGEWKDYDLTGALRERGSYLNDKKSGQWSFYYTNYVDDEGNSLSYSGELYLTVNYQDGMKNGLSIQYSSVENMKYLCDESGLDNANPTDTCLKFVYLKEHHSMYFKNDVVHGLYTVKDSTGVVTFRGNIVEGEKDGEWLESYVIKDINEGQTYIFKKGNYRNGKKIGKWREFINEEYVLNTSNYINGKLEGEKISYLQSGKPKEIMKFKEDYLKELVVYDSIGVNILRKYEIIEETNTFLKVIRTDYGRDNTTSLEYWMEKDEPVLNHAFFDLLFQVKTSDYFDGESCYPDGELKLLDNRGNLILVGNMRKDERVGIWKLNFFDQNVQLQSEYFNNIPDIEKYYILSTNEPFSGKFFFTNDENNTREERRIKNGLRNGITQFFDLNGKKIKTEKYKDGVLK